MSTFREQLEAELKQKDEADAEQRRTQQQTMQAYQEARSEQIAALVDLMEPVLKDAVAVFTSRQRRVELKPITNVDTTRRVPNQQQGHLLVLHSSTKPRLIEFRYGEGFVSVDGVKVLDKIEIKTKQDAENLIRKILQQVNWL